MANTSKYHHDRGGNGRSRLHWPGTIDGIPFRGANAPDLKDKEIDNIKLEADFKSQLFELWDPEQKAQFDEVNDRALAGWYRILRRFEHWDDERKHYRVWVEWCQLYGAAE